MYVVFAVQFTSPALSPVFLLFILHQDDNEMPCWAYCVRQQEIAQGGCCCSPAGWFPVIILYRAATLYTSGTSEFLSKRAAVQASRSRYICRQYSCSTALFEYSCRAAVKPSTYALEE